MTKRQSIFDKLERTTNGEWRSLSIAQETIPDLPDPRKQVLHLHLQYVQC